MSLFLISTKSYCYPDKAWWEDFRAKHLCPGCGALRPDIRQNPIDVPLMDPPDISAVNAAPGVGIIRTDFLKLFEDQAYKKLIFGRVLDTQGRPFPGYQTFTSIKPVQVRGGPTSEHRTCEVCSRFVYFPMGDEYVMHNAIREGGIHAAEPYGLVLDDQLCQRIERGRWKGIWITELPIRDDPLDGIDDFPEDYY